MNFIERAREVGDNIPKLKMLNDEKSRLDEYRARKMIVVGATETLGEHATIAKELQGRGALISGLKTSVIGLQQVVRRLIIEFRDDRTVIIAPEKVEFFWTPLKPMPEKVGRELKKVWKGYVESKIPSGQAEILQILSNVQGFADQAGMVKQCRENMRDLGDQLPKQEDFLTLDHLTERLTQAWSDLNGDGLPPAVLNFLKKAHMSGISLAELENDVLDWLRDQGLLGRYVIRGR